MGDILVPPFLLTSGDKANETDLDGLLFRAPSANVGEIAHPTSGISGLVVDTALTGACVSPASGLPHALVLSTESCVGVSGPVATEEMSLQHKSQRATVSWLSASTSSTELVPPAILLYFRRGWGQLLLQPLGFKTGLICFLEPAIVKDSRKTPRPLRILLPASQIPDCSASTSLLYLFKALAAIPYLREPDISKFPSLALVQKASTLHPSKQQLHGHTEPTLSPTQ
ncbi:unnamed protein product [Protopolystoma xenopodis]|uniref:Uncharacterized protein n=1 Tax=Protopolystoma xenopodis TaxID=117903 RepID=A0A3S5A5A3_9PLAT|nr:unnamed protein product [Protopolystoma xenopodis]